MNILVIGAGGVGASMASIAEDRSFFSSFTLADISVESAQRAIDELDDPGRFRAASIDARNEADIVALKKASKTLDKLLEAQGVDVESVVADFKIARRKASTPARKLKAKAA